jgi:hypothetical protein
MADVNDVLAANRAAVISLVAAARRDQLRLGLRRAPPVQVFRGHARAGAYHNERSTACLR